MYMSRHSFVSKFFKSNINDRYLNFLFQLPKLKKSLIYFDLLSIYRLVPIEKFGLIKKDYGRIHKIYQLRLKIF